MARESTAVLSVNYLFDRKMTASAGLAEWYEFNCTFTNTSLNVLALNDAVSRGHSICAQHAHRHQYIPGKNGELKKTSYRHHLNWMPTSIGVLDFDDGTVRMESIVENNLVPVFLTYTTVSHTEEHPRFRLVTSVERVITKLSNYKALLAALTYKYAAADPMSKNPVHAYAGNKISYASIKPGKALTIQGAREIISEYNELLQEEARQRQERLSEYGSATPDAEEIAELLRYIPDQQSYIDWLKTLTAVKTALGNTELAVDLCENWSPGYPGEVAMKMRSVRAGTISMGWLVSVAKAHGYVPAKKKFNSGAFFAAALRRV